MIPITVEPTKMTKNDCTAPRIDAESISVPGSVKVMSVRDRTMATASLSTDSPKTIEKRSSRTPIAWNTASTVTGSVAEMSAPVKRGCEQRV